MRKGNPYPEGSFAGAFWDLEDAVRELFETIKKALRK